MYINYECLNYRNQFLQIKLNIVNSTFNDTNIDTQNAVNEC